MITAKGVKVLDFGLAKCAPNAQTGTFDTTLTAPGAILHGPERMCADSR
jgi:hypothetical protein